MPAKTGGVNSLLFANDFIILGEAHEEASRVLGTANGTGVVWVVAYIHYVRFNNPLGIGSLASWTTLGNGGEH
jgi:hypothetical protein